MRKASFWTALGFFAAPLLASAHEAYVLPQSFFWEELSEHFDLSCLNALRDPHNLYLSLGITLGILIALALNFFFLRSAAGRKFTSFFESFSNFGQIFIRVAIAIAFFASAYSGEFLGPELSLAQMPFAAFARVGLYIASILILFGVFTEAAAALALIIFTLGMVAFGGYLVTYLNYLGEIIALLLFGTRNFSLDKLFFGPLKSWRQKFAPYQTVIVRVFYGLGLIAAAVNIKFLHTPIALRVVTEYNLTQFHLLFPSDPLLVVLGAGLAETAIGIFILLGFNLRLTVLISLFYLTLSLLFFREAVWPHVLLYGISFSLLVEKNIFSLDRYFAKKEAYN